MDQYAKAAELGIETEFFDALGQRQVADPTALKIAVGAFPGRTPGQLLAGPVTLRAGDHFGCQLIGEPALLVKWQIALDGERVAAGETGERYLHFPADLAVGSYQLRVVDASGRTDQTSLVVAPAKAFRGSFDRVWLLAVQLYAVRSSRNWGVGDFTDLATLIEFAAEFGSAGIGLNPLHALFDDRPGDCSPYSPNSRLFLNPLYLDVEAIAEFPPEFLTDNQESIARLRDQDVIDYAGVAVLKWRALRATFQQFKNTASADRVAAFDAFRTAQGAMLVRFACFETLRHKLRGPWWEWPEQWRQPDDAGLASLRAGDDARDVEYVEFVQWCIDEQLSACRDRAHRLGMSIGLYLDIAVGVQADGFDAWNEQVAISRHLSVGAPPDQLNTAGQNWGLAGFNAAGLEIQSFEPFRDMLRASMQYAGAVRLDHVLGLKRLYLVPAGFPADRGLYVRMPFEALLAVTALESVAHRCVVIGEDLGTVPEGFRDTLAQWGIWSYRVMMFERDHAGSFHGADSYADDALVTFNTHDLPTFAGWRAGHDINLKRSLGIDPGETTDARAQAVGALAAALNSHAIETSDFHAVTRFLARTRSRLLAVALEDLLGLVDQPNIPGTVDEHPNWRRRLPVLVDDLKRGFDAKALQQAVLERAGLSA